MTNILQLIGRIMLASIFVIAGFGKIADPSGTTAYMQSVGLPSILLWPTIALELLGGLAIMVGYQVTYAAFALSGFSVLAALLFHTHFSDQMQMILFLKNIAMAGGLLLLSVGGTTGFSIDNRD